MKRLSDEDIQALQPFWQPQDLVKPEDPRRRPAVMYVGPQLAGVRVTMDTWWQVGAAWACVDVISKAIASSDWNVFERTGPRRRRELPDDNLTYLLNTRPNPDMTAQAFRRALMVAALSWGNGYAEIVRDMAGRVAELHPIHPDRVEPQRDRLGQLVFVVKNDDGSSVTLQQRDVLHIRGPSIVGLMGDNHIAKAAGTIALSMATQKFAEAYFGNGTQLGGIMEYPGELNDQTFERLEKQFNGKHQGPGRAFRTAWIDQGMKFHQVETDAESAQLVTARQQDVEDVCRWFGVPPHKVQHLLRATNNNIEHQGLEFTRDCLRPWARELQQEADHKLFSPRGPKRFTLIDLDWAAEGDFKSRMEGLQIGRSSGVINGNEWRAEIGYDDMGPEGDVYIVQGAMMPLSKVGAAYKDGQAGTAPKPAAPAVEEEGEDEQDETASALAAWLSSTFERAQARMENRRADLARSGREDAADLARKDAANYLSQQIQPLAKHLSAWAGRDCTDTAYRAGLAVFEGTAPADAAATLINELKGEG